MQTKVVPTQQPDLARRQLWYKGRTRLDVGLHKYYSRFEDVPWNK